jgi:hypothetical protein
VYKKYKHTVNPTRISKSSGLFQRILQQVPKNLDLYSHSYPRAELAAIHFQLAV